MFTYLCVVHLPYSGWVQGKCTMNICTFGRMLPFACTCFRTPPHYLSVNIRLTPSACFRLRWVTNFLEIEERTRQFLIYFGDLKFWKSLKRVWPTTSNFFWVLYCMWSTKQKGFWEFINNLRSSHNEGLVRIRSPRTSSVTDVYSCTEKNTKRDISSHICIQTKTHGQVNVCVFTVNNWLVFL